ncbi:RidA family protein [Paenibacillus sp. MBLB4367]|uniref:RidA family protein n=1 Tax=Paenibacillus sp. MBLB4367 TaxID=3384767 RepID=UPI003908107A
MRKAVYTEGSSKGDGPYSQGIVSGGFVWVSGQGPLDPKTGAVVGGTIEEQARLTMDNIKGIVEAAGSTMDEVVKITVYLERMSDFAAFNRVYQEYFSQPFPARTCVQAGLDDILVEIDAVAKIPDNA